MKDHIVLIEVIVLVLILVAASVIEVKADPIKYYNMQSSVDARQARAAQQQARALQQIADTYQQQQNRRSTSRSRWNNSYKSNQTNSQYGYRQY